MPIKGSGRGEKRLSFLGRKDGQMKQIRSRQRLPRSAGRMTGRGRARGYRVAALPTGFNQHAPAAVARLTFLGVQPGGQSYGAGNDDVGTAIAGMQTVLPQMAGGQRPAQLLGQSWHSFLEQEPPGEVDLD